MPKHILQYVACKINDNPQLYQFFYTLFSFFVQNKLFS